MKQVDLFGGAAKMEIPKDFIDASELRQIPDHQEAFIETNGFASLIIEINEMPDDPKDEKENINFYIESLQIESSFKPEITLLQREPTLVCKNQRECLLYYADLWIPQDHVTIKLALFRIPFVKSDILISLNQPTSELDFAHIVNSFELCDWDLFK